MNKKYMVLFPRISSIRVSFLLKVMHCSNILFILQVKMPDKGAALNLARKKKQEKKPKQNESRVANLAKKKNTKNRRAKKEITFRRTVDFNTLVWQLKDSCSKCNENPLLLTNVDFNEKCSSNRLAVVYEKCHKKNLLTLHSEEVE